MVDVGKYRHRIRIEEPVADGSLDGAGSGTWELVVGPIWARIEDMRPSRGERLADGINVTARPAKVLMRWRTGITSAMRICVLKKVGDDYVIDRILQIVAGPAEIGNRDELEFMCEEYSPAGNRA